MILKYLLVDLKKKMLKVWSKVDARDGHSVCMSGVNGSITVVSDPKRSKGGGRYRPLRPEAQEIWNRFIHAYVILHILVSRTWPCRWKHSEGRPLSVGSYKLTCVVARAASGEADGQGTCAAGLCWLTHETHLVRIQIWNGLFCLITFVKKVYSYILLSK